MADVIFDGAENNSQDENLSSSPGGGSSAVSKHVLNKFQDYFNNLEYEVLVAVQNYYNVKDKWPTYRELAEWMDLDKNTVQPRLSELRDAHVIQTGEKRECDVSNHNTNVSTFKVSEAWRQNDR